MNEHRDKKFLEEKYLKEKLSCGAIGRLCNKDAETIRRWLYRLGVPVRSVEQVREMKRREKKEKEKPRQITEEERQSKIREILRIKKNLAALKERIKEEEEFERASPAEQAAMRARWEDRRKQIQAVEDGKYRKEQRDKLMREIEEENKKMISNQWHGGSVVEMMESIQNWSDGVKPRNINERDRGKTKFPAKVQKSKGYF